LADETNELDEASVADDELNVVARANEAIASFVSNVAIKANAVNEASKVN
jgi:hypothetical protein